MLPDSLEANVLVYRKCPANTNDVATPLIPVSSEYYYSSDGGKLS